MMYLVVAKVTQIWMELDSLLVVLTVLLVLVLLQASFCPLGCMILSKFFKDIRIRCCRLLTEGTYNVYYKHLSVVWYGYNYMICILILQKSCVMLLQDACDQYSENAHLRW
jgi:hypothetical protein